MLHKTKKNIAFLFILYMLFSSCGGDKLPSVNLSYKEAHVFTRNDKLYISTGNVERVYKLTPYGLSTVSLKDLNSNKDWILSNSDSMCDWNLENNKELGELTNIRVYEDDDEKFTDRHICVELDFDYHASKIQLKYLVWVYPDAKGFRTQLKIKGIKGFVGQKKEFTHGITETICLKDTPSSVRAFGYMQGKKTVDKKDILREESFDFKNKEINWASGLHISSESDGLILIKESNKSTSLSKRGDVATGSFAIEDKTIFCNGMGMYPKDVAVDKYLPVWANWVILASNGDDEALLSLKEFDRMRYPVHSDRDVFIMANTWGTEDLRPECLYAAREENVLKELESVADLGIDILQIDDGWQTKEWLPAKNSKEHQLSDVVGSYSIYPVGWDNVKERSEDLNVKLGLWSAWAIPLDKLLLNYDLGMFSAFKLDFVNLTTIAKREELMNKARQLIKHSNYQTCVNWDVTEIQPRVGFYFGREYGNVYLENRKVTTVRPNVQYIPYRVLQNAWLLSKYVNLNKFQVTIQNIDMTKDDTQTDAKKHNHPYVVGIALMSSPIFFQETHYYSEKARAEIKKILSIYKEHRQYMYEGYVFPIGDKPNNESWTGFQNHHPSNKIGYLTLFRELHNKESKKKITLMFALNKRVKLINLLTNEEREVKVGDGSLLFEMNNPASFEFYRYEILD